MAAAAPDVIAAALARSTFPPAGARVDLAVSGGPDSMALLVLARAAGLEATAHHVDHALRPGSAAEADVVRQAAEALGAGFAAHRAPVAPGPDLEARARRARYGALPAGAMTGHTADDQAETVLLNLIRGAGLAGLAGIRHDGRRPLLQLRRSDTEAVCAAAVIEPLADPTNGDVRIRRNAIRHRVLPLLDEVAERDVAAVIARQAARLADDEALLAELAAGIDVADAAAVAAAPPPLARRAVRRWLAAASGGPEQHPPGSAAVERVLAVARGDAVGCEVAGGWRVRRSGGRLRIEPPAARAAERGPEPV